MQSIKKKVRIEGIRKEEGDLCLASFFLAVCDKHTHRHLFIHSQRLTPGHGRHTSEKVRDGRSLKQEQKREAREHGNPRVFKHLSSF